jgi:hypothetical protein
MLDGFDTEMDSTFKKQCKYYLVRGKLLKQVYGFLFVSTYFQIAFLGADASLVIKWNG